MISKRTLQWHAFREAAALLEADVDSVDLNCDEALSAEDASGVREYIRTEVVGLLEKRAAKLSPMTLRTKR